jgi:hypothetical protein
VSTGSDTLPLQVEVPADMHRRFKATAALNGKTMREATMEALTAWMDTHSSPSPAGHAQ